MPAASRTAPLLLTLAALCPACAHAPEARPPVAAPEPWPGPQAPQVRWVGALPAEPAAGEPSFWSKALHVIAGTGAEAPPPALVRPFGVAAGEAEIFVADPEAPAVYRVDRRSGAMAMVDCPDHAWGAPMAVALDGSGALYVADQASVVRVRAGTCAVLARAGLSRPSGLAFAAGRLYAVDPPRHQVIAFGPDGSEVLRFGSRGEEPGELNFPTAIAAAPDGSLLVIDALNFRVDRFSPDGRFLSAFGEAGDSGGAFGRPKGVAADARGRIYVSDVQHDVVLVFSPGGEFAFAVGRTGAGPGQFLLPAGLAVAGGFLFVADSYNHRVQVFELLGGES